MHEDSKTASRHNTRITMTINKSLLEDVDEILKEDIITRTQFITMAIKEKLEKEQARKEIMLMRN